MRRGAFTLALLSAAAIAAPAGAQARSGGPDKAFRTPIAHACGHRAGLGLGPEALRRPGEALPQGRPERRVRDGRKRQPGALLPQGAAPTDPRVELEALHHRDRLGPLRAAGPARDDRLVDRRRLRRGEPGALPPGWRRSDVERQRPRQAGGSGAGIWRENRSGPARLRRLVPRSCHRHTPARDQRRADRDPLRAHHRRRLAGRPRKDLRPALPGCASQGRHIGRQ